MSSGHSGDEPEGTIRLGPTTTSPRPAGSEAHTIDAGAGDDLITLAGFGLSGAGAPTSGSAPADIVLDGGTGRDTFDMGRRRSGDVVLGGPGADVVTYAERTPAVSVTLDGLANDGTGGEGDDIAADVEESYSSARPRTTR